MGMQYARYLPKPDFDKAAEYLERGLRSIEEVSEADLPTDDRAFHTAFLMNGLALVRHRQKRAEEAVELCRAAASDLETYLRLSPADDDRAEVLEKLSVLQSHALTA
jgi:hypothetical protein